MKHSIATTILITALAGCVAGTDEPLEPGRTSQAEAGALTQVTGFGSNPAQLGMYLYVPTDMPPGPRPLVVAMHGCSMTASSYAAAGWQSMAELWKFYVVYPQQNTQVNNSLGCFNWGGSWDGAPSTLVYNAPLHTGDLLRGHTENLSIKQMVDYVEQNYDVDGGRVYATGVSAGGGMTAVMLATYPDVFAGGAIVAGIPYGCTIVPGATTQQGTDCTKSHPESDPLNRDPQGWGDLVRAADPGYSGPWPVVSIWQGGADYMVAPDLRNELVEQWTNVNGIDQTPDDSTTVNGAQRDRYQDAQGHTRVEVYYLPSMSHGQPVDPGDGCGTAGSFIIDEGICTAKMAGQLFGLDKEDPTSTGGVDAGPGGGGGGGGGNGADAGAAPGGCCDAGGGGGGGGSATGDRVTFRCNAGGGGGPILLALACLLAMRRKKNCRRRPTA